MASELKPCPFCRKPMMLREALWPSEGDTDAIIHADKTDCPMFGFGDGSADGSIVEKWNICSSDDEDDFPSDGSCIRCGSVPRNANGLCNTCLDEDAERLENTRPAPADTDTGLETVAWQHQDYDEWHETRVPEYHKNRGKNVRELVTRSQAEAIIRDLETKILDAAISDRLDDAGAPLSWQERAEIAEGIISDLKADNAAKDARIKELDRCHEGTIDLCNQKTAQIKALEAKLAAAREALEPFADHAKERAVDAPEWRDTDTVRIVVTIGDLRKARAVLGGKP